MWFKEISSAFLGDAAWDALRAALRQLGNGLAERAQKDLKDFAEHADECYSFILVELASYSKEASRGFFEAWHARRRGDLRPDGSGRRYTPFDAFRFGFHLTRLYIHLGEENERYMRRATFIRLGLLESAERDRHLDDLDRSYLRAFGGQAGMYLDAVRQWISSPKMRNRLRTLGTKAVAAGRTIRSTGTSVTNGAVGAVNRGLDNLNRGIKCRPTYSRPTVRGGASTRLAQKQFRHVTGGGNIVVSIARTVTIPFRLGYEFLRRRAAQQPAATLIWITMASVIWMHVFKLVHLMAN